MSIEQSHANLVARIASAAIAPISIYPAPQDFRSRALLVELLLSAVKEHLTLMVSEAAEHDASTIVRDADLIGTIDAHLCDLAGDIAGTFQRVAERLAEDIYGGVSTRGPMHRVRS